MKEETRPQKKTYDAVEDAIELSKKDPTKTWEDLTTESSQETGGDKGEDNRSKKAAAAASHESRLR